MVTRRTAAVGLLCWAAVGASIALAFLSHVNADARILVGLLSVAGPTAAVAASRALEGGHDRAAGILLLCSVLTPTYFAWVVNVPALLFAVALLVSPGSLVRPQVVARP